MTTRTTHRQEEHNAIEAFSLSMHQKVTAADGRLWLPMHLPECLRPRLPVAVRDAESRARQQTSPYACHGQHDPPWQPAPVMQPHHCPHDILRRFPQVLLRYGRCRFFQKVSWLQAGKAPAGLTWSQQAPH